MRTIRIIFLSPLALLRLILVLLITFLTGITGYIWLRIFGFSRSLQNWVLHTWGKSILLICGIVVHKNEIPDIGNSILMPNHRGYQDIFILSALTPAAFISKAEVKKWPFMGLGAKLTNSFFVNRSELKSLMSTMNKIKKSLENEIPVAIFPEGTTYKGPLTRPFKKGSFKIAADALIPVIPIAIHYRDENDAWVGTDTFVGHFLRQMSKPISRADIIYGDLVKNNDYTILMQQTKEKIDNMLVSIQDCSSAQ